MRIRLCGGGVASRSQTKKKHKHNITIILRKKKSITLRAAKIHIIHFMLCSGVLPRRHAGRIDYYDYGDVSHMQKIYF